MTTPSFIDKADMLTLSQNSSFKNKETSFFCSNQLNSLMLGYKLRVAMLHLCLGGESISGVLLSSVMGDTLVS